MKKEQQQEPRCVTPTSDKEEGTNESIDAANHDASISFPDSDIDSSCYSVGPFAHNKSEGTLAVSWTLKDFICKEKDLGSGKFGDVELCSLKGRKVALKVLDKYQKRNPFKREVEIQTRYVTWTRWCLLLAVAFMPRAQLYFLKTLFSHSIRLLLYVYRLSHASILQCLGYFQTRKSLYIVLEYASGGDLAQFMATHELSTQECKSVVKQVASALAHLQDHKIAHRDVKMENVLVTSSDLQVKLADFGTAVYCPPNKEFRSTLCGTLACLPPEMLSSHGGAYNGLLVDSWSLGIFCHEIVLDEPVFSWTGNAEELKTFIRKFSDANLQVPGSPTFSDFVSSLLKRNPKIRMTPRAALEHAWLAPSKRFLPKKGIKRRRR